MTYESPSNQEQSPQQKRIAQAERRFVNARLAGFPEPLATKHAARWNAIGVERDQISQKAWETLATYAQAGSMNHPSLTDIMQTALERRLVEKPPELDREVEPEREQAILELLSQPEFTENKRPFVDLEELYEEFKTIAKKYSTRNASQYWLFTRNVSGFIQPQLRHEADKVLTQGVGNTFYQELSAYLSHRAIEELRLEQPEQLVHNQEQNEGQFTSIDELYRAYKAFTTQNKAKNAYQSEVEWLASLDIKLSPKERKGLAGTPTIYQEDYVLSDRNVPEGSDSLDNEELKGLRRLLDRRQRAEEKEYAKAIDTQREVIQQPEKRKQEMSPNKKELNEIIAHILDQIEPFLDGDAKDVSDTLKEVAEQEYPRLPEHLKAYLQESVHESGSPLLQDTAQNIFARLLIVRNGSRVIQQKHEQKEKPKQLPWYKRLFKRK